MRLVPAVATMLLLTACTPTAADHDLGCADSAAWGTVTEAQPDDGRIRVTFQVDRWVVPGSGAASIDFLVEDPSEGGGTWWRGDAGLLVLDQPARPLLRSAEHGDRTEADWRAAGSPTRTNCPN